MDNSTLNLLREARDIVLKYKLNDSFRRTVDRDYAIDLRKLYGTPPRPFIQYIRTLVSISPRYRQYLKKTGFGKISEFLNTCANDGGELERLRLFLANSARERARPIIPAAPTTPVAAIKQAEKAVANAQTEIDRSISRRNFANKIKLFEGELKDPVLRLRLLANKQFTKTEIDIILKNNLHEISNFQDEKAWQKAVEKASNQIIRKQSIISSGVRRGLPVRLPTLPRIPLRPGWVATGFSTSIGAALGSGAVGGPAGIIAGGAGGILFQSAVKKMGGQGFLNLGGKALDAGLNFFSGLTQIATVISPFKKVKLAFIIAGVFFAIFLLLAAAFPETQTTPSTTTASPGPSTRPSPSPIIATTSCPIPNGIINCGSSRGTSTIRACHCAPGYSPACDPNSRRGKAVDIVTPGGSSDRDPVYLPVIRGQSLKWYFRGDFDDTYGASIRVFQSERTADGVWTIHFVHSKRQTCNPPRPFSAGPCFSPGQEITNLTQPAAFMDRGSSNRDGSNIHTHVSIGLNVDPWDQNNLQYSHSGWKFADAEMDMCGTSTPGPVTPVSGLIANFLPNPLPPPVTDWQNIKTTILAQINASPISLEAYRNASTITGIPWEVLAGIHFIEGSNNPNQSLVSGRRIGEFEPDIPISACNSGSTGPGIPIRIGAGCGFDSLLNSTIYTGNHLKNKIGGSAPANYEELVISLSLYNGGGNRNCYTPGDRDNPRTPYTGCPRAFLGEDDIYPMSKFDQRHSNMYLVYCGDRITCNPPRPYTRYGVMTVVRALAEP